MKISSVEKPLNQQSADKLLLIFLITQGYEKLKALQLLTDAANFNNLLELEAICYLYQHNISLQVIAAIFKKSIQRVRSSLTKIGVYEKLESRVRFTRRSEADSLTDKYALFDVGLLKINQRVTEINEKAAKSILFIFLEGNGYENKSVQRLISDPNCLREPLIIEAFSFLYNHNVSIDIIASLFKKSIETVELTIKKIEAPAKKSSR